MSDERMNVIFQQKMTKIDVQKKNLLGIFDSGIGGFSVFKEVRKNTTANIIYYGDCARAPYGNKSEEEIVEYIKEILLDLKSQGVTHFVSACNSISVLTTEKLLHEVHIDPEYYFDMISAVKVIPFETTKKVLIIGTKATITSGVYQQIFKQKNILHDTYCPSTLAGDIELDDTEAIAKSIEEVLTYALEINAETILYACTHYPLVSDMFISLATNYGWNGEYIDPAFYLGKNIQKLRIQGESRSNFQASLHTQAFLKCVKKYPL